MGQVMSTSQFFLYGKRHFTKYVRYVCVFFVNRYQCYHHYSPLHRTGYLKHLASYTEPVQNRADLKFGTDGADDKQLKDKTILITGANSGLGKQVAMYCAAKDANVIMMCRNPEKAETAKKEIERATDNGNVRVVLCDLAELSAIDAAVKEIKTVDCIVCNAGVLLNDERTSKEGWEMTFASHLMGGTYYLTKQLLPKLQSSDDGRVVIVTSGGMYNTGLPDWNTMTSYSNKSEERSQSTFKYDGNMAYAYAKRGQVVLAEAWSQEWGESVTVVTAHPGWTETPAVDEAYGENKKYLEPMREPWQGAEGIAWLVATDRTNLESGSLYLDRAIQRKHLAGPFFSEGGFTKNTPAEVKAFLENLKKATGV